MFKLNLKIVLRNLWKNKVYTLINVGGLAIGLASCMILLLYVAYEWGYDKQFTNYKNTYILYTNHQTSTEKTSYAWTPGVMAPELKAKISGVKYASHSSYPEQHLIGNGDNSYKTSSVYADPDFLKILDYKFLKGNPDQALKKVNTVILTESLAKKLFGTEDPINKTVKLDNKTFLKVEGIMADLPKNSSIQFEYLMPWSLFESQNPWIKDMHWQGMFCLTMVQLVDEKAFNAASQMIKGVYLRNDPKSENEAMLHPLSKWHLYSEFQNGKSVGGKITQVRTFFLLALCILFIACVNFMNLSTARSEKRAKEVGVRKVIGSTRKMLISQFMLESFLLTIFGLIVGFVLIEIGIPYFNGVLNTDLNIDYSDWELWCALIGLTFFTGLVAGSYPAFYLSSFDPVKALKGFRNAQGSSLSVRKILVIFQFVFAACLIIFTTIIYQQINYIKNKSIGYNKNNLVEISLVGSLQDKGKLDLLKEQLLKTGAVNSVTNFSRSMGQMGHRTMNVSWPGKTKGGDVLFNYRFAGYDFVKTIDAEIADGRDFSMKFSDSANVIVNETAVSVMGLRNPVGTLIGWGDRKATIIGVVKDFIVESPFEKTLPMVIGNDNVNSAVVVARLNPNQNLSKLISQIDEIVRTLNPGFPVERKFIDDNFEEKFGNEKLLGTVANWFGGFAIFISCLGLLGLALYMAEQRKKEISIRKVLGASNMSILELLNKDFIKLVTVANLIAFPLAYIAVNKWLSHYDFRVSISIIPFCVALFVSLIIAILTVSVQSVKVAKANPIDALKYE
ncbi:ABC transporter permease [Pedobacter sp. B4-66]|uniref:ABC transporter permease n=1 Tax=Pedobacter sp. B4-66 TaxID=2817280 RepID=UPI001BDAC95E|nr:ABC transporter permease [Pedobacter sp. B4-66]